jgi:hypothetical protein
MKSGNPFACTESPRHSPSILRRLLSSVHRQSSATRRPQSPIIDDQQLLLWGSEISNFILGVYLYFVESSFP